jgi:LDH2 family malate/lactate/ureidoglycolate dehydrogenase
MPAIKRIPVETIYNLMTEVFSKLGVPKDEAKICADVLIASDLSGIESHGIGRLKMYYDRIKSGIQFATTNIDVVKDFAAIAVWDGNHGMGKVIAYKAMQEAIDKAKKFGIGCVTVRNSTHYGIAGYYPKMATAQNMIGMSVTNARPSIAPLNGVQPMLGTNPIAFGAPSDLKFPFLFDAATSISQRGKIEVLGRKNKPTPEFWAIDDKGNPFTETQQLLKDLVEQTASLVALGGTEEFSGGHKGYGLATIVEILSSALQAGSFMHSLSGFEGDKRVPYKLGHFFMAINPEVFGDVSTFKKTVGDIMRNLQNSTKKPGCERIYVAGEKEYLIEAEIREIGVPINAALNKNIQIMIDELGIEEIDI